MGSADTKARLHFAVRFALIAGLLFALYGFPYAKYGISEHWLGAYLNGYAEVVGALLRLVEDRVVVQGNTVYGATALRIVRTCDAMEANVLFASAVIAFPGPLARKALVLVVGLSSIAIINLVRIMTLYHVVLKQERAFTFVHLELWPLLMIIATLGLFVASIRFLTANRPAAEAPPGAPAT
jgi:exosortase/archaeosortase family protein